MACHRRIGIFSPMLDICLVTLVFVGCQPSSKTIDSPPTASIVVDPASSWETWSSITLNGSGTDPQGYALTYSWVIQTRPAGSAAALSSSSVQSPTFIPDLSGLYVFKLTVTASTGGGQGSATASIDVAQGTITANQASTAARAGISAASIVMNNASSWTQNGSSVSFSAAGLSMTGTTTTSGTSTTDSLDIAFSNFADAIGGCTMNGTITLAMTTNSTSGAISGTVTGTLTLSGGPVTTETWNASFSGTLGGSPSYSGTIACDGIFFVAASLGLATWPVDTTPPANVIGLAAVPADAQVTLSWAPPSGSDFAFIEISAPGIPTITVGKGTSSYAVTGLLDGASYTFTVKSVDTTGNKSTGVIVGASLSSSTGGLDGIIY